MNKMIEVAVFYAMRGEIGESLKGFSQEEEYRPEEWQKGRFGGVIRRGIYRGREIILAQTGIQAKEVAEFVLSNFSVKRVVIAATCGGIKEELKTGDLVVCSPVCSEGKPPLFPDPKLCALAIETLREGKARFCVGNNLSITFYASIEEKNELTKKHPETVVVQGEDYFITSVANSKRVPWVAVRVVDDTRNEVTIWPPEERNEKEQLRVEGQYRRITTILRDEFLLPFLRKL